ncbi:hypothetical protein ACJX0J_039699, partial [Zea mays]
TIIVVFLYCFFITNNYQLQIYLRNGDGIKVFSIFKCVAQDLKILFENSISVEFSFQFSFQGSTIESLAKVTIFFLTCSEYYFWAKSNHHQIQPSNSKIFHFHMYPTPVSRFILFQGYEEMEIEGQHGYMSPLGVNNANGSMRDVASKE